MKKDTLKARAQSAKSAKAINDMVSRRVGWGGGGPGPVGPWGLVRAPPACAAQSG
jgi:hypothetical protein